jgi:hypothetical protein
VSGARRDTASGYFALPWRRNLGRCHSAIPLAGGARVLLLFGHGDLVDTATVIDVRTRRCWMPKVRYCAFCVPGAQSRVNPQQAQARL